MFTKMPVLLLTSGKTFSVLPDPEIPIDQVHIDIASRNDSVRNTLIDAGPIIALFDRSDKYHQPIRTFLQDDDFRLITTWPAITEASHMLDFDVRAQVGLLKWIYRGGLRIHEIDASGLQRVIELTEKYRDQQIGRAHV